MSKKEDDDKLTMRDKFAMAALTGLAREYRDAQVYTSEYQETGESICESAYELADLMLKVRERNEVML